MKFAQQQQCQQQIEGCDDDDYNADKIRSKFHASSPNHLQSSSLQQQQHQHSNRPQLTTTQTSDSCPQRSHFALNSSHSTTCMPHWRSSHLKQHHNPSSSIIDNQTSHPLMQNECLTSAAPSDSGHSLLSSSLSSCAPSASVHASSSCIQPKLQLQSQFKASLAANGTTIHEPFTTSQATKKPFFSSSLDEVLPSQAGCSSTLPRQPAKKLNSWNRSAPKASRYSENYRSP
ncbi:unnamed protein product, partial [Anisakis simplex]